MKLIKIVFIGIFFSLLSSCGSALSTVLPLDALIQQQGKVFLKNEKVVEGAVSIVGPKRIVKVNNQAFSPISVEKVVFYNPKHPEKYYTLRWRTFKFIKKQNVWVWHISSGQYVDAFVWSRNYRVDENGDIKLVGIATRSGYGAASKNLPTFYIYFQKKNDELLQNVGMLKTPGVIGANPAFRRGVRKYLKDDPKLCEYIKQHKLGLDNVDEIVGLYDPNRGNKPIKTN